MKSLLFIIIVIFLILQCGVPIKETIKMWKGEIAFKILVFMFILSVIMGIGLLITIL